MKNMLRQFHYEFVSYFPLLVKNSGEIISIKQYVNLRNVIYSFNIEVKMILLLHEILIHLSYRYLNILTGGEINNISLKVSTNSKNNDNNNEIQIDTNSFKYDGGSFFRNFVQLKNI